VIEAVFQNQNLISADAKHVPIADLLQEWFCENQLSIQKETDSKSRDNFDEESV
jgi:hypothetical protein